MHPLSTPGFPPLLDVGGDLILRAVQPDDAEAVFALMDSDREHLRVWLPWVDGSQDVNVTRAFLEQDAEQRERGMTATFLILEAGVIAGLIGLHAIDRINRSFLIGYWLSKRCEGRGLVTRSCQRLLETTFDFYEMERAVIRCAVGNTRSAAVPKRLGFKFEGIARHGQKLNDGFVDLEIYGRLSRE